MHRIVFSFFVLALCSLSTLQAQLKFDFTGGTAAPGSTIDIDVVVSDFDQLISLQLSINWDPSAFTFNSIENVTTDLKDFSAGSIATPPSAVAVDEGELTISWNEALTNEVSIPDETRLFTLRLNASGSPCASTTLTITDDPRTIEVVDLDFNEIGVSATGGEIMVEGTDCGSGGGGGGGGNTDCTDTCEGSTDASIIAGCVSGDANENVCVTVTGRNLNSIGSIQTGVSWDSNILSFTGITEKNLTGIVPNTNETADGRLRILWLFSASDGPVTLANDSELFDICFDIVGNGGQESEITLGDFSNVNFNAEVANGDGVSIPFCLSNGQVDVDGGTGGGGGGGGGGGEDCTNTCENTSDVALVGSCESGDNGDNICVTVTSLNFNNIASVQTGITWNENVIRYTGIQDKALTGITPNENDTDSGNLRFLWLFNANEGPLTLADGTELFDICFDVIGSDDQSSKISFESFPDLNYRVEIADGNGMEVSACLSEGQITVGEGGGGSNQLTLTAPNLTAEEGEETCMNVTVRGFNDIQSAQFTIEWDESVLTYKRLDNVQLPEFGSANANEINSDKLRISWNPLSPASLSDNTSIFQLCFDVIGDCNNNASSNIRFINDGNIQIEFSNSNSDVLTPVLNNGSISVMDCNGGGGCNLTVSSTVEDNTCSAGGSIALTVDGASGELNFDWDNDLPNRADHSGLNGGTYCVTITDGMNCSFNRCYEIGEFYFDINAFVTEAPCDGTGSIRLEEEKLDNNLNLRYEWDSGLSNNTEHSNLQPGQYCVTITEPTSGCSRNRCYTVAQGNELNVTSDITDVTNSSGNNGAIDLTISPSDGLTFEWSNGSTTEDISGLSPGEYSVVITGGGTCESTLTFTVNSEGIFATNINAERNGSVSCQGETDGIISGEAAGGCGGSKIFLDGEEVSLPVEGLAPGSYTIRVEDDCGSSSEKEITISEPDAISFSETIECSPDGSSEGSIELNISGGAAPYSTDWSRGTTDGNNVNDLSTGSITVLITDANGCEVFEEFQVGSCTNTVGGNCNLARNVISPNGDGINDQFVIGCLQGNESQFSPNELGVYDRWGNQVFGATNYDNSWEGTDMSGTRLNEGGYMWVLKLNSAERAGEIYRGTVTLLRSDF